jgi:hypothetical protein
MVILSLGRIETVQRDRVALENGEEDPRNSAGKISAG